MNFDRNWTIFALDAEVEAFGTSRIASAHNKLRAEVAELKRDAERYRWLRDAEWMQDTHPDVWDCIVGGDSHLDEAIDAVLGGKDTP